MESTKLTKTVNQFLAFLSLSAIIQPEECHAVSYHARSVNLSVPKTFVQSIFDEFGSNNSMNSQQFNSLLEELNIGSSSNEQASENDRTKVRVNYAFIVVIFLVSFNLSPFFACFVRANLNSGRLHFRMQFTQSRFTFLSEQTAGRFLNSCW